jgi:hypothetical protein
MKRRFRKSEPETVRPAGYVALIGTGALVAWFGLLWLMFGDVL